jgi:transposase
MTHSIDLRNRVVNFVRSGGSKAEASRRFEVSVWCVQDWFKREELGPKKYERRKIGKLDWQALSQDVSASPDSLIRERATRFGVHKNTVWYALQQMKISRKKKHEVH